MTEMLRGDSFGGKSTILDQVFGKVGKLSRSQEDPVRIPKVLDQVFVLCLKWKDLE